MVMKTSQIHLEQETVVSFYYSLKWLGLMLLDLCPMGSASLARAGCSQLIGFDDHASVWTKVFD